MNDPRPDAELRDRFQRLRSEERDIAPDFGAMLEHARAVPHDAEPANVLPDAAVRRIRRRWFWAGGSVAAAAAIGALLLLGPGMRADRRFERAVRTYASLAGGWRTPTDALLQFPGSEITRSVPRLGTTDWPAGAVDAPRRARS